MHKQIFDNEEQVKYNKSYQRGRTGFDRGHCIINSEPGFHLPVKRWENIKANNDFALAA